MSDYDTGKAITRRIRQYGLDEVGFGNWVARYCEFPHIFDPKHPSNRIDEYKERLPQIYRGQVDGIAVSFLAPVIDALCLEWDDEVAPDPRQFFFGLKAPLDFRFAMRARQIAKIGTDLQHLLNRSALVVHRVGPLPALWGDDVYVQDELAAVRIHRFYDWQVSADVARLSKEIKDKSAAFSLGQNGPCELSDLMSGTIGLLACEAGAAGVISVGRVREILRMR